MISYDPNYREKLWPDQESARFHMQSVLQYVDMIKVSDEELEIVTGEQSLENACAFLHSKGVTCVAITLGKKGHMLVSTKRRRLFRQRRTRKNH